MMTFVSVVSLFHNLQFNDSLALDKALVQDPLTFYQRNASTMDHHEVTTTPSFHSIWKYPLITRNASPIPSRPEIRALALLSMGPGAADSTLVERCIISIRKRGKFLGPIMLVTDAPLERYESLTREDYYFIVLHPEMDQWNWDLRRDMPYKRFKTYLLDYLRRDDRLVRVQLVYYLDIDVVVGQPLMPWFDHVEQTYMNYTTNQIEDPTLWSGVMALFDGNISPLQGGQFVLQKGRSEVCLNRWRYHIDANPTEHKDQPSLTLMWKEQHGSQPKSASSLSLSSSTNCTLLRMPQDPYLKFLSAKEMSRLQGSSNDLPYPTLMHIKNTQHANTIPDALQKKFFQNLLELSPDMVANITSRRRIRPNRTWSALQVKGTE
jgi:hypothetical protein